MSQLLLFPDPRPLVERLGADFFREAPEAPGVYLMRDSSQTILYVGKARNLRKRLASYRCANPDRLARRQLMLLRTVDRIDLLECESESAALAREAELLRNLRPRFNRAGTWVGEPRFLAWRITEQGIELELAAVARPGWTSHGPLGAGAVPLRRSLLRLLWCVLWPERGYCGLPSGWFSSRVPDRLLIRRSSDSLLVEAAKWMEAVTQGDADGFATWLRQRFEGHQHRFETAMTEEDLTHVTQFFSGPSASLSALDEETVRGARP